MNEALEPCPFCGGEAVIKHSRYAGTGASGMETPEPYAACRKGCVEMKPVRCTDWPYGRQSKIPTSKQAREIAIEAWNTRAAISAIPTDAELVEAAQHVLIAWHSTGVREPLLSSLRELSAALAKHKGEVK